MPAAAVGLPGTFMGWLSVQIRRLLITARLSARQILHRLVVAFAGCAGRWSRLFRRLLIGGNDNGNGSRHGDGGDGVTVRRVIDSSRPSRSCCSSSVDDCDRERTIVKDSDVPLPSRGVKGLDKPGLGLLDVVVGSVIPLQEFVNLGEGQSRFLQEEGGIDSSAFAGNGGTETGGERHAGCAIVASAMEDASSSSKGQPYMLGSPPQDDALHVGAGTWTGLPFVVQNLVAVSTKEFQRYERSVSLERVYNREYMIPPYTTSYPPPSAPTGWKAYTHPEGALFFYDETRRILTDAYLYDGKIALEIENYIRPIMGHLEANDIELPEDCDLVLEPRISGRWGYYFADHQKRCLFWLEPFDAFDFLAEVKVDWSLSHVGHEIEAQYWYHNELYPNVRDVSPALVRQLKDQLIHAVGDTLTSQVSTAPYDLRILLEMLHLADDIEGQSESRSPGSACILFRLLGNFAHEHFLNLHGQPGARLCRDQSIHGNASRPRTMLMTLVDPIFFFSPSKHLRKLETMSVDSIVNKLSWEKILSDLTSEWSECTLFATVLLNANVAFLAIQSVDAAGTLGYRSPPQVASYLSTALSVGATILGLLISKVHHTSLNMSFLANRSVSALGLETLALLYSLPYTLLMWSMVSFIAAFSSMCYLAQDLTTYIVMSMAWFSLGLLTLWCISTAFEEHAYYHPAPYRVWQRLKGRVLKFQKQSSRVQGRSMSDV